MTKKNDSKYKEIEIPEFGGKVKIRSLTPKEALHYSDPFLRILGIIRQLATLDPMHAQGDCDDMYCFFCGADEWSIRDHGAEAHTKLDCLWLQARRLLGLSDQPDPNQSDESILFLTEDQHRRAHGQCENCGGPGPLFFHNKEKFLCQTCHLAVHQK